MKKAILAIAAVSMLILIGFVGMASAAPEPTTDGPGASVVIKIKTTTDRLWLKFLPQDVKPNTVTVNTAKGNVESISKHNGGATIVITYEKPRQAFLDYITVTVTPQRSVINLLNDEPITKSVRGGILFDFIPTTYHWPRA